MAINDRIDVKGYVTKEKFIAGKPLFALERLLGFNAGRLTQGATIAKLDRLPRLDEFELAAYSITAQHRLAIGSGLNIVKLKQLAASSWSLVGLERLVKVLPFSPHNSSMRDDDQYPPGEGVPQWRLTSLLPATVSAELKGPSEVYRPAF